MTNEFERPPVIDTALFAAVGVCAAIGVWSGFSDGPSIGGKVIVTMVWLTLTVILLTSRRVAVRDGFEAGVTRAYVDPVTRLPSSGIAKRLLDVEFAAAERGRPLTVVFFSLDDFARLSSKHGEGETKKLLVGVGATLKKRTRGMNISARYDENGTFISVLGSISSEGAATFASKVAKDLRQLSIGGDAVNVSSIVVAYDPVMQSADQLLSKAKRALSLTRERGPNRLMVDGKAMIGEQEGYAIL